MIIINLSINLSEGSCYEIHFAVGEISTEVIFAGEHCRNDYPSTLHGAYLSGCRAAEDAIQLSGSTEAKHGEECQ